jgi:hypothetical protein
MKHCPACNFSFPDFHKVCDFDGTELVPDAERPHLAPPQSRFRRAFKSPVVWAAALLMFVMSSAFLVAYLEATVQPPAIATVESRPAPSVDPRVTAVENISPTAKTKAAKRLSAPVNSRKSTNHKSRRPAIASRSVSRREQRTSRVRPRTETVRREDRQAVVNLSRRDTEEKEPKLTAALKTTWRFLKKPFRF